ncbi:hypothetical protein, partial [Klebsiella pneumoniae]|uniref:hypothetical protein n=1 Tax=Klebsiella pneumoniae TaxID=573 RepID=UPI0024DF038D
VAEAQGQLQELPLAGLRPLVLVALVLSLLLVGDVFAALLLVLSASGVLLLSLLLGAVGDEVVRPPTLVALGLVTSFAAHPVVL